MESAGDAASLYARFASWRAARPATTTLVGVLTTTFVVQSLVWWLFGFPTMAFWFAASADPSPGWLLAPLGHQSVGHLFGNLLFLVVFGSLAEADLSAPTWYWLFASSALAGTAAQVWSYLLMGVEGGAVGASAGVVALVAFVAVRTVRDGPAARSAGVYAVGLAGGIGMVSLLFTDFVLTAGAGSAEYAHLIGVAVGGFAGLYVRG
ncbi:rhomboid family intramembrane serine protease [Salinigranum halophilum]|uniref:rhomboid family intramembrane serine protease n=1 Tax=Salinigranum halophilum TaxID=2565931 RepID=UPI0010A91CCA|nr:rhomboid family intramembrane serine protease [Salinigranum halophilum]